ncbi:MAG: protoporphyrinogen oxidase [Microlunatus sp.]
MTTDGSVLGQPEVLVVGGGISGLAAARRLALAGRRVLLLEGSPRLGGKLAAAELAPGLGVDVGAESVLVRRPEAPALISSLGLDPRLVHPTGAKPKVYVDGHPVDVPPSVIGVPDDIDVLSGLLSPDGLARARREPSVPAPQLPSDLAIGELIDERFGPEVTDRLLEPLLGGVYAGHARRLSFAAVNPALFERARSGGALSSHAAATRRPGEGPVFGGLVGGIAGLVDALAADLRTRGIEICHLPVRALATVSGGYRLTVGSTRDAREITAPAVVLATPATPTARLLAGVVDSAAWLGGIPYASMAVVALAVRGVEPEGSGLLVPPGELPTIKAVTHSSAKWAWVAEAAEQTLGPGVQVIRASVGRLGEERLLQIADRDLIDRTVGELRTLPGWSALEIVASTVQRWGGGLPQYEVGHRTQVTRLQEELASWRGLAVCGAAYDGVGIAACLGSAEAAASKITADLDAEGDEVTIGKKA